MVPQVFSMPLIVPSRGVPNNDTPITRDQRSNAKSITKQYGMITNTKNKLKTNINKVRQLAYALGAERKRSYSTNRVTKMI